MNTKSTKKVVDDERVKVENSREFWMDENSDAIFVSSPPYMTKPPLYDWTNLIFQSEKRRKVR
jgi:hypothetical protein